MKPNLPDKLRMLRLTAGLTQTEIAKRMDIEQATYSKWECGKARPPSSALYVLAHVLHIDPLMLRDTDGMRQVIETVEGYRRRHRMLKPSNPTPREG